MALKKLNPENMNSLSSDQMQNFKGGAGLCGNAEIFFPNNPVLNDVANKVAHWWQNR